MLKSPFPWVEEVPESGMEQSVTSFGGDFGTKTLRIRLRNWADIEEAIPYIVGTSSITPQLTLSRKLPAAHPYFPNMRATKILSVRGDKAKQMIGDKNHSNGVWTEALVEIMFEMPKYPVLQDNQISGKEYNRFVTRELKTNLEVTARKGETWVFTNRTIRNSTTGSIPGERSIKLPKGILEWNWYDVHEDWILLGKLFPTNFFACIGTVNRFLFPQSASTVNYGGGVVGNALVQFQPGTLLMLPPQFTMKTQCPTDLRTQFADTGPFTRFPRTYDVKIQWIYFDPPTDDGSTVMLPYVGGLAAVPIRGHNLLPLPLPSRTGYTYYAACKTEAARNGVLLSTPANPIPTDNLLLYRYTDHEQVFSYAQPLPGAPIPLNPG